MCAQTPLHAAPTATTLKLLPRRCWHCAGRSVCCRRPGVHAGARPASTAAAQVTVVGPSATCSAVRPLPPRLLVPALLHAGSPAAAAADSVAGSAATSAISPAASCCRRRRHYTAAALSLMRRLRVRHSHHAPARAPSDAHCISLRVTGIGSPGDLLLAHPHSTSAARHTATATTATHVVLLTVGGAEAVWRRPAAAALMPLC